MGCGGPIRARGHGEYERHVTEWTRVAGSTTPAPAKPRKRRSGASGLNLQQQRQLRANPAVWALVERALAKTGEGWSDWARAALVIVAADELGIDPLDALRECR
jgi:hypothetical protein